MCVHIEVSAACRIHCRVAHAKITEREPGYCYLLYISFQLGMYIQCMYMYIHCMYMHMYLPSLNTLGHDINVSTDCR